MEKRRFAGRSLAGAAFFLWMIAVGRPAMAQQVWRDSLRSAQGVHLTLPYSDMALSARFIGPAASDKDWFIWCFSPIWGQDGRVHAFCSRWPAKEGMEGWTGPNAEIAHYVSDKPEGPFRYVSTVMKTSMFPDPATMSAPHNPRLEYVDGKYVLLYICQNPSKEGTKQRVGMMVADRLEGPWRFAGDRGGIMVDGKPAYLYGVADVNVSGGKVSEPYVFKVEWEADKSLKGKVSAAGGR